MWNIRFYLSLPTWLAGGLKKISFHLDEQFVMVSDKPPADKVLL